MNLHIFFCMQTIYSKTNIDMIDMRFVNIKIDPKIQKYLNPKIRYECINHFITTYFIIYFYINPIMSVIFRKYIISTESKCSTFQIFVGLKTSILWHRKHAKYFL